MPLPHTVPLIVPPPGASPLETATRTVEEHVEATIGWDGPTTLFWLLQESGGVGICNPALPKGLGRLAPTELFPALVAALRRSGERPTAKLLGLVTTFEVWGAFYDDAEVTNMGAVRRPSQRADRVEMRLCLARLVTGEGCRLVRIRGGEPQVGAGREMAADGVAAAFDQLVAAVAVAQARA